MSYQAAENLRKELRNVGIIETWIVSGGVDIQCYKHELKKVLRVINSLRDSLDYVSISIGTMTRKRVYQQRELVRKEGKLIVVL